MTDKNHAKSQAVTQTVPIQERPAPLAYSVDQACEVTSLGRTAMFALIRQKRLEVVRVGRRTLILASSLRALLGETQS